jgi:hypothetical protein
MKYNKARLNDYNVVGLYLVAAALGAEDHARALRLGVNPAQHEGKGAGRLGAGRGSAIGSAVGTTARPLRGGSDPVWVCC